MFTYNVQTYVKCDVKDHPVSYLHVYSYTEIENALTEN